MKNLFPLSLALALASAGHVLADDLETVMQTDRDFAAYAQEHGPPKAFEAYMGPDAVWLPIGAHPIKGRAAIVKAMSQGPEYEMNWSPEAGEVSGDLAYTWGRYTVRYDDPEEGEITGYGKYLMVWKRQPDGSWRWVVDTGNPSPPPGSRE